MSDYTLQDLANLYATLIAQGATVCPNCWSNGLRAGQTGTVMAGAETIAAVAWAEISPGTCTLVQAGGRWYALPNSASRLLSRSVRQRHMRPVAEAKGVPGVLMWLDGNWLTTYDGDKPATNGDFFFQLIDYFLKGKKKLYTLSPDSRCEVLTGVEVFGLLPVGSTPASQVATEALNAHKIEVVGVSLASEFNRIQGPFYLPLFNPQERLTAVEAANLVKLSKKYGVLICGEWQAWTNYDNSLLQIFGVNDRIRYANSHYPANWVPTGKSQLAQNAPSVVVTDAIGTFSGCKPEEVIMVSDTTGEPAVILFQAVTN